MSARPERGSGQAQGKIMPSDEKDDRFGSIDARISALREARKPKRTPGADKFTAASMAWRMVIELVVGVLLGAAIGWGLDGLAGTTPLFLLVFGALGFAAGVRTMMRSAAEMQRRDAADAARNETAGSGPMAKD
jgi:ATP synthase protein I